MPRPAVVVGDAPDTAGSPWLVPVEPTEPDPVEPDPVEPTDLTDVETNPGGSSDTV